MLLCPKVCRVYCTGACGLLRLLGGQGCDLCGQVQVLAQVLNALISQVVVVVLPVVDASHTYIDATQVSKPDPWIVVGM